MAFSMSAFRLAVVMAAAGLLVGWVAAVTVGTTPVDAPALLQPSDSAAPKEEVSVVVIQGALALRAHEVVRLHAGRAESLAVVALRKRDCLTCEDLGRQLREFARRSGESLRLVAFTEPSDSSFVRAWLARERLRPAALLGLSLDSLVVGGRKLVTPAVLVIDGRGVIKRGVAHPRSARNYRRRSFAQELGFAP